MITLDHLKEHCPALFKLIENGSANMKVNAICELNSFIYNVYCNQEEQGV